MFFRLSTLFLLLLSAIGALSLGTKVTLAVVPDGVADANFGGGYWFQEIDASSSTTMKDEDLQVTSPSSSRPPQSFIPPFPLPQLTGKKQNRPQLKMAT